MQPTSLGRLNRAAPWRNKLDGIDFAAVAAARTNSRTDSDGTKQWSYTGTLIVQGVTLDFECDICYKPLREVYAVEVLKIESVGWTMAMRVA